MARIPAVLGLLFLAGAASGASPVQKVIELLEENRAKVVKDLAAEEKEMGEYADFCDKESSDKGYAIKTAERKVSELTAEISDGEAQIAAYQDEIAALGASMAEKEKELAEAEAVRSAEKDAFAKNEKELVTSIDELERAVAEIKRSSASFLQVKGSSKARARPVSLESAVNALARIVDASWVNGAARKQIQGLLQTEDGDDLALHSAPKAAAYDSATGGITATLEEMEEKAESSLEDARGTEMKRSHSFEMIAQSLTDAIAAAKEKTADAKSGMSTMSEQTGENKAELAETEKNKASDEAYLASLTADCTQAHEDWAARQADAKDEMAALEKAKDILADKVKVFVQVGGRTAKKGRGDDDSEEPAEARTRRAVLAKLKSLSHTVGSYALMEMVDAVAADPFEKIKGLIENMIAKLTEEANEEATQKAFCDEETKKSTASKDEKTMKMDKLKSRLDTAASKKAELEQSVKELEAEIAALDKATAEATALRTEEKASNAAAAKDYKEAAEAVESAMAVLKEYYEGASLAQVGKRGLRQPAFGSKKSDSASSILSILEMCGEDFTKMYMEITQSEAEAEAKYEKLTSESQVSKAAKLAEVKGSLSEVRSLEVSLKDHSEDYAVTSQELDAVLAYLDKLKPQCESKAMSYGERKAAREAELEGLKEALSILEGTAAAAL